MAHSTPPFDPRIQGFSLPELETFRERLAILECEGIEDAREKAAEMVLAMRKTFPWRWFSTDWRKCARQNP